MKKLILFLPVFCFVFFAFTSVEIGTRGTSPGLIQAIGNAGGDQVLTFQKWKFINTTIPENKVENIQVSLEINTSSITCDWKDLEKGLKKKKDYFYIKKFPKAIVEIDGAKATEDGNYQTDAEMTIRGITKKVPLTFTISDTIPYQVKGEGLIIRQDFGFTGGGPKDEVPIMFDVILPQ